LTWASGPEGKRNIGLRLERGMLGIDVDAYGGKAGARTIADAEQRWGALPSTVWSSSRDDGVSRIRFYRIPEGLHWPGDLGDKSGVELIQYRHRYAVVWPSIHPEGRTYRWFGADGNEIGIPDPDQLPALPDAWVQGLTRGEAAGETARNSWKDDEAAAWVASRPGALEPPCRRMRKAIDGVLDGIRGPGATHVAVCRGTSRVVRLAEMGHAGLLAALTELHAPFMDDVMRPGRAGETRTREGAQREWRDLITSAVNLVSADPSGDPACDCDGKITDQIVTGPARPQVPPAAPVPLADALAVFNRWLHLDDDAPVLVTAATVTANNADGDPAWVLLVGPPSSGKTETLQAAAGLAYVHSAATVTEAALLSGVSKRERDRDATGGLLRQVGEYGIVLCKDFTSVLSQNKDVSAAALAALREVYDGSWDRPVGTGGGKVLSWSGKCGLVGGVTPSIDRYAQVVGALGDRFLLLRLPDVDPASMAGAALDQGGNQRQMRAELAAAMTGLITGADLSRVTRPLGDDERNALIALATYTARARTVVERNGYTREVEVMPQAEGTGRIVGQFRRLFGGLEAVGCDAATAWRVLYRVAVDCVPRLRHRVIDVLLTAEIHTMGLDNPHHSLDWITTGKVASAVGVDWKTANRHLEDLRLIGLADRDIVEGEAGEKPTYYHRAADWLRKYYPRVGGLDESYYYMHTATDIGPKTIKETGEVHRVSYLSSVPPACEVCQKPLDAALAEAGETTHPGCAPGREAA
jgi:hypothetical protein